MLSVEDTKVKQINIFKQLFKTTFQQEVKQSKKKTSLKFTTNSKVSVLKFKQAVAEYTTNCLLEWEDATTTERDEMVLLYRKQPIRIFRHVFFNDHVHARKKIAWKEFLVILEEQLLLLQDDLRKIDREIFIIKKVHKAFADKKDLTGETLKQELLEQKIEKQGIVT